MYIKAYYNKITHSFQLSEVTYLDSIHEIFHTT